MTDEPRLSTSDIAAADRHNTEAAARDRLEQERHEAEQRQAPPSGRSGRTSRP